MLGDHGRTLLPFASATGDAVLTTAVVVLPAFICTRIEAPFLALRGRYAAATKTIR